MTDDVRRTPTYFASYADPVVFPRSAGELVSSTLCPACFTLLSSTVCAGCGLDVGSPATTELAATSAAAASLLAERVQLIGRIRWESARAAEQANAALEAQHALEVQHASEFQDVLAARAAVATPPIAGFPIAPPAWTPPKSGGAISRVPRRSSVQVIMVIVGVTLLSIAAVFFLVYAFITYGIVVRSAIIAAITVAAFAVATMLKRRKLRSTAEGIAVFAAVLLYLDAYAVRANDLFGAGATGAESYWGTTLIVSSVVLLAWNRASRLRVPSIVGFAALAPGVGLLAGGAGTALPGATQAFLIAAATAAAGLAHPLSRWSTVARGSAERILVLVASVLALIFAFGSAFFVQPDFLPGPTIALSIVGAIAAAHVALAARTPGGTVPATILGSVGATAFAFASVAELLRNGDFESALFWPPLVALSLVLLLEVLLRRATLPYWRPVLRTATVTAAVLAGLSAIAPTIVLVATAIAPLEGVRDAWSRPPGDSLGLAIPETRLSALALAVVAVVAAVLWLLPRPRRRALLTCFVAALAVVSVPLLDRLGAVVAGWLVLGVLATAALIVVRRRGRGTFAIPALLGLAVLGTLFGYLASWASVSTWGWGSLAALTVLIAARFIAPASLVQRTLLVVPSVAVLLVASAAAARQLGGDRPTTPVVFDSGHVVAFAAALVAIGAIAVPRANIIERRVALALGFATLVGAWASARGAELPAGPPRDRAGLDLADLVVAVLILAVLAVVLLARPALALGLERLVATVLVAPALLLVFMDVLDGTHVGAFVLAIGPFLVSLLMAGVALVSVRRPFRGSPRWAVELGIVLVAAPATIWVLLVHPSSTWLALVLLGVTILLTSVSSDGLFGSRSPRRLLGWLALAAAVTGLWWRLGGERVTPVEPYVLPLAGALLIIAVLLDRAARREEQPGRAAPVVALAALLIGVIPIALAGSSGDILRPILVGGVSVVLIALGTRANPRSGAQRAYLAACTAAGAAGVLLVGVGRTIALDDNGSIDVPLAHIWLGGAFLVLVAAAVGAARRPRFDVRPVMDSARAIASQGILVVAMIALLFVESGSLPSTSRGDLRIVAVVCLLAVVHVGCAFDHTPFTRLTGWAAIACGGGLTVVALVAGTFDVPEDGTVPLAVALLAAGAIRMARVPGSRSWALLGPGVLLLLVPSLLATATDRPLWRLVALGIVAVATLAVGAGLRLQAPFVLGAIVAILHGIATFSMQIRLVYETVPWWLWLGVGGVILILLAVRLEKRIQNLRDVAMRVGSLR